MPKNVIKLGYIFFLYIRSLKQIIQAFPLCQRFMFIVTAGIHYHKLYHT